MGKVIFSVAFLNLGFFGPCWRGRELVPKELRSKEAGSVGFDPLDISMSKMALLVSVLAMSQSMTYCESEDGTCGRAFSKIGENVIVSKISLKEGIIS